MTTLCTGTHLADDAVVSTQVLTVPGGFRLRILTALFAYESDVIPKLEDVCRLRDEIERHVALDNRRRKV